MILYTSDKNKIIQYADKVLHDAFLFLIAGIVCAVFGMIYELFSHEVYSFYMIYAFLIPLVPGALLNLVIAWLAVRKEKRLRIREAAEPRETRVGTGIFFPGRFTRFAWNAGIAALTVGSIFKGVLDIYGTTNKLIAVYPLVAAILLCAAVFSFLLSCATIKKMHEKKELSAG